MPPRDSGEVEHDGAVVIAADHVFPGRESMDAIQPDDPPSPSGRHTARAIGVPVFVLTPRDIWVATPEGAITPLVVNRTWATGLRADSSCVDVPNPRVARIGD